MNNTSLGRLVVRGGPDMNDTIGSIMSMTIIHIIVTTINLTISFIIIVTTINLTISVML